MYLRKFARAIGNDWLAKMSGPPTVPLAIAAYLVSNQTLKVLFVILALACGFTASYSVWLHEYLKVEKLQNEKGVPKIFLKYQEVRDIHSVASGFFVEGEGDKKAFDVTITSEDVVGLDRTRIGMRWEVPSQPIGSIAVPVGAYCVRIDQGRTIPIGGISGRQIHILFEKKSDFPNEFNATLAYKDVDGRQLPPRKLKISSERDYRGAFKISCIPIES